MAGLRIDSQQETINEGQRVYKDRKPSIDIEQMRAIKAQGVRTDSHR